MYNISCNRLCELMYNGWVKAVDDFCKEFPASHE